MCGEPIIPCPVREVDIPVNDTQSDSQHFYYSIRAYLQLAVLYSFAVGPNDDDMQILVPSDWEKLSLVAFASFLALLGSKGYLDGCASVRAHLIKCYCGCIDRLVPFAQLYVGFCK